MRIHLHLGVHKTASTFVQSALSLNRAALNAAGIGYMPLDRIRQALTMRLEGTAPPAFRIDDQLQQFFDGPVPKTVRGIIVSDENLLGSCPDAVHTGHLYGAAMTRLSQLSRVLQGHDVTLFLSVRSYDTFIPSLYCEALRWMDEFVPFRDFEKRINFASFCWPSLHRRVTTVLQPSAQKIWLYEDFRANAETIVRALAFDFAGALDFDLPGDLKAAMSQAAVERLEKLSREVGPKAAGLQIRAVDAALPKAAGQSAFSPWPESERGRLRSLYDEDCRALPDVWLVRPDAISEIVRG